MLTVFSYAKLWRRSGALTDINFYELRYSGRPAAFLRGFRAIYLGVFFNIMIMATVTLAAIKPGVLLGLDPYMTVVLAALITMVYSTTAGLWGVVVTDFFQFALAMIGSFAAAYYAVSQPSVGGLSGLMSNPLAARRPRVGVVPWIPAAEKAAATSLPRSSPGFGLSFRLRDVVCAGYLLYGRPAIGISCAAVAVVAAFGLWRTISKVGFWTA